MMNIKSYKFTGFFLLLLLLQMPVTFAGSTASDVAILDPDEISTFAKNVEKYAADKGARAFIIARVGTPPSDLPKDITFTHSAIAIYSSITLDNGEIVNGYAIHNLYQDEEKLNKSNLVTNYPVDFFWNAYSFKAGIIIPTLKLQQRLIDTYNAGNEKRLHNPRYSLISNPFNNQLQNCTEYTLDIINSSIYQTTDLKKLKANATAYYKPQRIKKSLKLMLGSMFNSDIATKDHRGKIYTATFTTIAQYLADNHLVDKAVIFNKDGSATGLL